MTKDNARAAAEIVVEQRHIEAAQAIYDTVPLFAMGHVKARPSHDLVQAFARFERDHMPLRTDAQTKEDEAVAICKGCGEEISLRGEHDCDGPFARPSQGEGIAETVDAAILAELERQEGIGAGNVHVDQETGLLSVEMDIDGRSLSRAILAALRQSQSRGEPLGVLGWIVSSADGQRFRCWDSSGPAWTDDPKQAVRYARRIDAEAVHAEDEDAWRVIPFDELAEQQS